MCLPFFHEYKVVDGWHGINLFGTDGTCLEKVCKKCGKYTTEIRPGYINVKRLVEATKETK